MCSAVEVRHFECNACSCVMVWCPSHTANIIFCKFFPSLCLASYPGLYQFSNVVRWTGKGLGTRLVCAIVFCGTKLSVYPLIDFISYMYFSSLMHRWYTCILKQENLKLFWSLSTKCSSIQYVLTQQLWTREKNLQMCVLFCLVLPICAWI